MLKYYKLKKQDAYINKKLVENQDVVVSVGYDTKTDTTLPSGYIEYPKEKGAYIEQDIMGCVYIDGAFVAQEYPEEPIEPKDDPVTLLKSILSNMNTKEDLTDLEARLFDALIEMSTGEE